MSYSFQLLNLQNKKRNIPPIKKIYICPWRAPGVKDDEVSNAPTNELFGYVPKTKAAPAGYTPFVPEGCGLLVNKESGGGGGLTWADCDDEDVPVLVPVSYQKNNFKEFCDTNSSEQ